MDADLTLKSMEGLIDEDGVSLADKMDLNSRESKEECWLKCSEHENELPHTEMQVSSNEGHVSSSMPMCEVSEEETRNKLVESNLVCLSFPVVDLEEAESKKSDFGTERAGRPHENNEKHEHDSDADTTVKGIIETEDLNLYQKSSSDQGDNDRFDSSDKEYHDKLSTKSSTPDEAENGNYGQASVDPQREGIEDNEEIDDRNLIHKSNHQSQMRGGGYSTRTETPQKGRMVWENSSLQSPQENLNVSPSPERRLSVSAELSPYTQSPAKDDTSPRQEMLSPAKFVLKSAPSPLSPRRRHSPSPEKRSLGHKRSSSRDRSSPSKRLKSPSDRPSKRETQQRVDSPKRRLSRSPRKNDSPRRRGRSISKSPTRRRGSPRHQRDRQRSLSKSPIARNHNRRSPRRQSPTRRSPPTYHPRQRSPRRTWCPPTNRSTGIGRPGKNLFIAGFSYATTERDLERKFSKYGRITDVRVVRDKSSGDSRGFGFLSLERDEDADAAIRGVDQTEWNGRIVLVEKSKTSTR